MFYFILGAIVWWVIYTLFLALLFWVGLRWWWGNQKIQRPGPAQVNLQDVVRKAKAEAEGQTSRDSLACEIALAHKNLAFNVHRQGYKLYQSQVDQTTITKGVYLIEGRNHQLLPVAIQNIKTALPSWQLHVICSLENEHIVRTAINVRKDTVTVLHQLQSVKDFNQLILSPKFWASIASTDKVLLTQIDAFFCDKPEIDIEEFFQYDYVGAPWINPYPNQQELVGNCGCCLCSREALLTLTESSDLSLSRLPPDVLFAQKIRNKPSATVARAFSVENLWHDAPIAVHQPFGLNNELLTKLETNCTGVSVLKNYRS